MVVRNFIVKSSFFTLLMVLPLFARINFVQQNYATSNPSGSSVVMAYPAAQTAGNLNIVVVGWKDTSTAVRSVTDSRGNTYTLAVGPTSGTALTQSIYYAKNIAGGSNTVTVTFNQAAAYPDVRVLEYSGADPMTPLDATAAAVGNSRHGNSGPATITTLNELIFGAGMTVGTYRPADNGFTKRVITNFGDIAEDATVLSMGSYSATTSLKSSAPWVMQMATFRANGPGSPPPPAPTVTAIAPSSGPASGGTGVTITGTGFQPGATVSLGGTAASTVVVGSSTSITATTTAHAAGAVNVVVTNPDSQSGSLANSYTYGNPAPMVSSIAPSLGPVSGGTRVTITGTGFQAGATVSLGGTAASNVVVGSSTITATTAAHAAGAVNVVVTNGDGQSGTLAGGYTYTSSSGGGISFVQVKSTAQMSSSSVAIAYPNVQTAGDLNVVAVMWLDTTSTVSSVTDSKGNAYALAVGPSKATGLTQSIYYAKNIGTGSNTVTVTFNQTASKPNITVLEYSGLDTANPLDVTASASSSGTTANSGSATTTSANELIVGAGNSSSGLTAAGPGFSSRMINGLGISEDRIVGSTGSYNATATMTSGSWVMQMATFRGSGQGSPPNPAPTVTAIAPNSGPTSGGTGVTITGTGFQLGATVRLGGMAANTVVVGSSTSITATTAAHAAGAANVVVTNPDSQSGSLANGYSYGNPGPTVSSIAPSSGPTSGGTMVAITGTGFQTGATVSLGGTAASTVFVGSSTSITATTATHAAGAVNVVVTNPDSQSGSLANGYSYGNPGPTVSSIAPSSGPTSGGTMVAITGTGFQTGATVSLGGTAASTVFVGSSTSITATTATHAAGAVNVVVTNGDGQSGILAGGYTYTSASGGARTYTTNFPLTENPISEGGNWINGLTTGLDWSDISTTPGLAIGHEGSVIPYSDATAVVTGTWGPGQSVQATAFVASPNPRSCGQELELRLRTTISAHSIKGYEISYSSAYGGLIIVRWDGPVGAPHFSVLNMANVTVRNGDVMKATMIGSTITAYKNGSVVLTTTDSTYTSGSPGIGINLTYNSGCSSAESNNYGFSRFTASDGTIP